MEGSQWCNILLTYVYLLTNSHCFLPMITEEITLFTDGQTIIQPTPSRGGYQWAFGNLEIGTEIRVWKLRSDYTVDTEITENDYKTLFELPRNQTYKLEIRLGGTKPFKALLVHLFEF